MYTLFVILIVVVSILMIAIVLIQESKGGGLSSQFQGGNAIAGVRKTTDIVEKTTWGLAIAMVLISIVCAYTAPRAGVTNSVIERVNTESNTANPNNVQGFGASQSEGTAPAATPAATEGKSAPAQ